tara:strand:+ start:140 stop:496 length:357 start_codon:yes stop_codon:yes gene_type:complete
MQVFQGDRNAFMELIRANQGTIVFKFGAEWCEPCKNIKDVVETQVAEALRKRPDGSLQFFDVDVDECFDLYAFLKTKKMVRGIPVMLKYDRENDSYAPDGSISGTDHKEIETFFRIWI